MPETCDLHPEIEKTCGKCAAIERGRKAGSVKSAKKTAACRVNIAAAIEAKRRRRKSPSNPSPNGEPGEILRQEH